MTGRARRPAAALRAVATHLWPAAPGLLVAVTIAAAARELAALAAVPPLIVALGLGMLFAGVVNVEQVTPGVTMATRPILRIGVALLGAQLTFGQLADLGWFVAAVTVTGLTAALATGLLIGRWAGLPRGLAAVAAAAVAVCGASAALAMAAALPAREQREEGTATVVAGVTVIGSAAMLAYPFAAQAMGFSAQATGVFLGATLHEVAQAVGAGVAISDEAGSVATAVKLLRVACLTPVVLLVGIMMHRGERAPPESMPPIVPGFLLGFFLLAALASYAILPALILTILSEISRFCLLVAIAALGMKVSLPRLAAAGPGLLFTMSAATLVLAAVVGGLLAALG